VRAAFDPLRLCVLFGSLIVACAPRAQGPLAGASDAWAHHEDEAADAAPPPAPTWDAYAEVVKWAPVNAAPFTSRGHEPQQLVDVRVSEDSRAAYQDLVTDHVFPDGTLVAQLPHATGREAGHGYAMRKTAGAWAFFELDPQGGVLASGPDLPCARCHAQAASDHLFGLPRAP